MFLLPHPFLNTMQWFPITYRIRPKLLITSHNALQALIFSTSSGFSLSFFEFHLILLKPQTAYLSMCPTISTLCALAHTCNFHALFTQLSSHSLKRYFKCYSPSQASAIVGHISLTTQFLCPLSIHNSVLSTVICVYFVSPKS